MDEGSVEKPVDEEAGNDANMFQRFLADMEKKLKEMLPDNGADSETGEQTLLRFEELKNRVKKMEQSASRPRTKTRITEIESDVLAEEARKREIDRVLQMMAAAQAVDLCFLVDCTGSMASYIQGVKDKIKGIIEKSKRMLPDLSFSVAFVGYRDHCDGTDRTVVLNFTTSILEFQSFMESVSAKGGGDAPEDVFGGIEEVTKLSWVKQTRILFHIADSPCHGTRFHDPSVGDEYPNGDPRGLHIEDLLSKLDELKIIYWFAKLGNTTDLMIKVFQSIMKINEIDLASADDLVGAVAGSISASVGIHEENIGDEVMREGVKGEIKYKIDHGLPDWGSLEKKHITVWKNKIPRDLDKFRKPLEVYRETTCSIKIAANPFAEGKLRIAYYGRYASEESGDSLVLKQFKYTSENQFARYKEQMEIQSVAIALADKFNAIKPAGTRDVHFADVSIVTFVQGEEKVHYAMEKYINGKYIKFNNNAGFVNETAYTATLHAFSHWSYWASGRYLMVVDLQGVKEESSGHVRYVLTDPAIHCGSLRRFGKTNLGREGMYKFFRTHYCNGICKAMALKFHRFQPTEVYTDFAGATVVTT
ncbi:alpha-protein kinase vwkA-like [Dendronephthya gigantea]|uniref:alpha-protein kinase vwkA-like n=1 Tax=Dendronephthya gigantea TaxID=151771 RepID=UPI00106C39A6|nr:alpha-protein kinase vwkA-like [Dendronephthya gigantea]